MKVVCKIEGAECPKNLGICCATCESRETCPVCCDSIADWKTCSAAETITDEMIQFQSAAPEAIQQITQLVITMQKLERQEKQLKYELTKAMEAYGVKSFENDQIKMVYVAPTTRTTVDGTRLKKDHPDLAKEYSRISNVSASVRITVK